MSYKSTMIACLCFLVLAGSCSGDDKSHSIAHTGVNSSDIAARAEIQSGSDPSWRVSATSVDRREDLVDVQLIDRDYAKAVGGKGTIFESQDGGKAWHRLEGGLPPNPNFARIYFVNRSQGWAVVVKSRSATPGPGDHYDGFLMLTEDAGKTWSVQYTVKNGSLNQIHFVNDREGWAVGSTRGPENGDQTEQPLILHTVDRGLHWTDSLKQSIVADAEDSVEDVYVDNASKAAFLTANGTIFTTNDAGGKWNKIKMPEPDYPQLANLRLAMDHAQRLWVLSSANSREVAATMLTRMESDNHWSKILLPDWYISDVRFLSPSEVVICGFIGQKVRQQPLENTQGIVAFSSDNGKTWKIILNTRDAPRINALAVVSPDQLLALGDNGWAFNIQRFNKAEAGN